MLGEGTSRWSKVAEVVDPLLRLLLPLRRDGGQRGGPQRCALGLTPLPRTTGATPGQEAPGGRPATAGPGGAPGRADGSPHGVPASAVGGVDSANPDLEWLR